jgi:glycosyltransferase involved in cell wall biosynthesis
LHSEYVSISESLGEYIQNLAPKAKVYLAHNFTTIPQESNFEPIKDWGKKKNILLIGRLSSVKGFDSVFKAIDASIIMQENYHFHVYGTGEEYFKYSKFLSDMRVDNVTIYNKWVDVSIAFYKQFHLVLLPSFNEGFPMVMLESLISNIPFIASPTGGISDFLPESWILAGRESQDFISAFERADSGDSKSLLAQLANKINSDYSQAYAIEQWKLIL